MDLKSVKVGKVVGFEKIGGINYQIEVVKDLEDQGAAVWGLTKYETAEIQIRDNLSCQKKRQTLIHEMRHAMLHEAGLDDVCEDEKLVNPLGLILYEVLVDNPRLIRLFE